MNQYQEQYLNYLKESEKHAAIFGIAEFARRLNKSKTIQTKNLIVEFLNDVETEKLVQAMLPLSIYAESLIELRPRLSDFIHPPSDENP